MLKINLLNAFSEPFPSKCALLNSILETANIKDLCSSFEFIVNHIFTNNQINNIYSSFSSDINNNTSNNSNYSIRGNEYRQVWPLKFIYRSQYGLEYDCIYNFLNTNSVFWNCLFKLDSLGPVFSISANSLPQCITNRIDSGVSIFASKIDAFNNIALSALEYYFFYFFMLLHDTRTNSRRVYNQFYGNIELDSVYADLLNDYLNFFLPITEREVNFPCFTTNSSSSQQAAAAAVNKPVMTPITIYRSHHPHPSLFKRVLQKSAQDTSSASSGDGSGEVSSATVGGVDRVGDLKKIDTFLRLINQLLVWPFTDSSRPVQTLNSAANLLNKQQQQQLLPSKFLSSSSSHHPSLPTSSSPPSASSSSSSSPSKYDDLKHNFSNLEIIFALSMIIKHCHFFSNASFQGNPILAESASDSFTDKIGGGDAFSFRNRSSHKFQIDISPLDELRTVLFKAYWRKSFYSFFQFHFENLPFTANLRWFVELWFTYIQPWKFNGQSGGDRLSFEFIKDNYFIYNDIYHLVLRRFCICDFTNEENLQILSQILVIFANQRELIKKCDNFYSSCQAKLIEHSRIDYQHMFRQYPDALLVFNVFNELEKPVHSFKSISGSESLKIVANVFESLSNTKTLINNTIKMKNKPNQGLIKRIYQSLFIGEDVSQIGNIQDVDRVLKSIDECINLLEIFYKSQSNFDDFDAIFRPKTPEPKPSPSDTNSTIPDYEVSPNGIKLTPKGRYQMLNGLRKPKIVSIYDPETAPIAEYENRLLVCLLAFIANAINARFGTEFESLYNRNDLMGKMAKKCLYGPNERQQSNVISAASAYQTRTGQKQDLKRRLIYDEAVDFSKPRLNLRKMASYKFILYFSLFVIFFKFFTGYSYISILLFGFFLFLCYTLLVN